MPSALADANVQTGLREREKFDSSVSLVFYTCEVISDKTTKNEAS